MVSAEEINAEIKQCELLESNRGHHAPTMDFDYPTRPKMGYSTVPDYDQGLLRMTKAELENVRDFVIENQHGRIQFLGTTDLTDVDLARDVTIKARSVDVYPDESQRPEIGQKLNKVAHVTLTGGVRPKRDSANQG